MPPRLLSSSVALFLLALAGCTAVPSSDTPAIAGAASPAPGVLAGGRIDAGDVHRLRAAGIRQVIDLTPDAETPTFDEAAAVRSAGMAYANLPLRGAPDLTPDNVRVFDAMLRDAGHPVFVHCASGNRVGAMAALRAAWIDGKPTEEAIAIGRAWGLAGLEDAVRHRLRDPAGEPGGRASD